MLASVLRSAQQQQQLPLSINVALANLAAGRHHPLLAAAAAASLQSPSPIQSNTVQVPIQQEVPVQHQAGPGSRAGSGQGHYACDSTYNHYRGHHHHVTGGLGGRHSRTSSHESCGSRDSSLGNHSPNSPHSSTSSSTGTGSSSTVTSGGYVATPPPLHVIAQRLGKFFNPVPTLGLD